MSNPGPRQQKNLRLTINETIAYLPGLSPLAGKELCARVDGGRLSSDGGVLLFPGIERRLGIADLLASCVTDERGAGRGKVNSVLRFWPAWSSTTNSSGRCGASGYASRNAPPIRLRTRGTNARNLCAR